MNEVIKQSEFDMNAALKIEAYEKSIRRQRIITILKPVAALAVTITGAVIAINKLDKIETDPYEN